MSFSTVVEMPRHFNAMVSYSVWVTLGGMKHFWSKELKYEIHELFIYSCVNTDGYQICSILLRIMIQIMHY